MDNTRTHTKSHWTLYAMLAVLLLAGYLRIHDLNAQGLWGDEGWSIWLARGDSLYDLTITMAYDHHGPVYSMLLRGWDLIAGNSVVALRTITVLFSISSIALIYALGRELLSPAAGVGAALAFTLMDKQVVLTQEVRDYPMVFFMMLLIALFYARWRREPGRGNGFGFVAATVIALYLHYYAFMVNLAIIAHMLLTSRDRVQWKHFIALNALIALAFAPWLPIVYHQFINTPVDSDVLNIHGMALNRHNVEYLATESLGTPLALYGLLLLAGLLAPFVDRLPGLMSRLPRSRRVAAALLAGLWIAVPVAITLALHTRYPLLTDRNISVIMPGIALLVGFGFLAFERYGALFIVTLVVVNNLFTMSSFYDKPPWREMAADIAAYYPGGEPVLIEVEGAHAALWYHLLLDLPVDVNRIVNLLPKEAEGIDPAVSLYDLRKRYGGDFVPHVQSVIADAPGLWIGYWGDEAKKHDIFDVLNAAGFVRTGTLAYDHHGNAIFAYRYDRLAALQDTLARFGNSIRLVRASWPESVRSGGDLNVLLWWRADRVPAQDYTVSVFLLDASGVLRAQHDGFPANGAAPMTTWTPDAPVFDPHTLDLSGVPPGDYTVAVKLYTWQDGTILPTAAGDDYAVLGTIRIK
jgi:mannosyltransferase